mmetsp:Transcript_19125/g.45032  ORF Transcript_19125/g.45032 Transcript_19125/m.45032 type:complete len:229 (-) Transcript_19125:277-963(-)
MHRCWAVQADVHSAASTPSPDDSSSSAFVSAVEGLLGRPHVGVRVKRDPLFTAVDDRPMRLQRVVGLAHLAVAHLLQHLDSSLPRLDLQPLLFRKDAAPVEDILKEGINLWLGPKRAAVLKENRKATVHQVPAQLAQALCSPWYAECRNLLDLHIVSIVVVTLHLTWSVLAAYFSFLLHKVAVVTVKINRLIFRIIVSGAETFNAIRGAKALHLVLIHVTIFYFTVTI